jgi:hypothetical protein
LNKIFSIDVKIVKQVQPTSLRAFHQEVPRFGKVYNLVTCKRTDKQGPILIYRVVWLVPLAHMWTCYLTNWIWKFYWVSNDKHYSKFNISFTLGLNTTKSPSWNLINWTLFKIPKCVSISLIFFCFDFIEFSMKNKIQYPITLAW